MQKKLNKAVIYECVYVILSYCTNTFLSIELNYFHELEFEFGKALT